MAQYAIAKPCPDCGSLLTYAGNASDANLSASCFICQRSYRMPNTEYAGPKVCSECGQAATLVPAPTKAESPPDAESDLAGGASQPDASEPIVGQDLSFEEQGGERAS